MTLFSSQTQFLTTEQKESMLKQKGLVIWLTGLSASGKTTIASLLENELHKAGILTKVFDGDNVRILFNNDNDFSEAGRLNNIIRIAQISKEFVACGLVVINCFISPMKFMRAKAKEIIGHNKFIEVFIDCPIEVCASRDTKGLYEKATKGLIDNFTGVSAPYEVPENPDLIVNSNQILPIVAAQKILNYVLPKIKI